MAKPDLEILEAVISELEPILDEVVFLGGSTISLFVTEPQLVKIRETFDVDCVVEVAHQVGYEEFRKKLRKIGFNEDFDSKVMCRFKKGDLILDVMPTEEKILGFTNIWYKDGFKSSVKKSVAGYEVNVFDLPYLVATKIEAFKGRGKGEFLTSHDIEDIVTLIDGRSSIALDLSEAKSTVLDYLKNEFTLFLKNQNFISSLEAHISDRESIEGRKKIILERIKDILSDDN